MSGHLIGCVKRVDDIGKSHKLALVAFADSADDRTHIGFPGYEGVMEWAACSRGRAAELIADLVEAGYLRQHSRARPGKRAEYVVFPNGCCELHRPVDDTRDDADARPIAQVLADLAAAGVELTPDQLERLTTPAKGSENPDLSSGDGSEIPDPLRDESGNGSEISDASTERVQNGSEISDAFTTTTTPPLPPASGGRPLTRVCQKHGTSPQPNCRGCGTTNRQIAEREQRAAAERRRQADRAAVEADRIRRESAAPAPAAALEQTRAVIARARTTRKAAR